LTLRPTRTVERTRSNPLARARNNGLDAVEALLHEALGRPGQAEAQPAPSLPQTVEQVRSRSWDQMTLVFASQFADEIASLAECGNGLLWQRLAALGAAERRVLREGLVWSSRRLS
jgi:hypothetical protein